MPPIVLSRDSVRSLDQLAIDDYGIPGPVLMENAGRGAAELLRSLGIAGKVCICCGKGNNGGDGLVVARHLDNAEIPVQIILFDRAEEFSGDAALNYRIVSKSKLPISHCTERPIEQDYMEKQFQSADWIVDALFGTGLTGPVRPPFDQVIAAMNSSPARVLAIDIPSGLDCDTGRPLGAVVRAHHTATFAAMKKGFVNPEAGQWLGTIHVIGIGIPRALLQSVAPLPAGQ
jgi:NAD(P)H-hydrate epimerase